MANPIGVDVSPESLGTWVSVGTGDALGVTIGKWLGFVGDNEITLGKLLEPETGAVGIDDAVDIGNIVGSALEAGTKVELPIRIVGIGGTLG